MGTTESLKVAVIFAFRSIGRERSSEPMMRWYFIIMGAR